MPEQHEYAPGTPSWVDIGTDVDAAKKFYGTLFGWDSEAAGPADETGGYGMFTKDGKQVAGFGPQQSPGPPFWATYVSVADADETAEKVAGAGGTVVMPPMQVMTAGRMAVFQDPQGAFISIWEPGETKGVELVNEPGALCWNELYTRDGEGSKDFYRKVFGWEPDTHTDGPMPYTEFQLGGQSVAGMLDMPEGMPAEVPPHWLVYFAVDDTDAAAANVESLGGSVMMPPMDIPVGRFAVVADPQHASFGVIRLAEQPS